MNVTTYRTLVFDCDGVVLDSNRVKTEAFLKAAMPYGTEAAQALADWHTENGGISRYKKFTHFLEHIVPRAEGPRLDALLEVYADAVAEGLASCAITPDLCALRAATPEARWMIVSGGDQAELRAVFAARGIETYFDGGIYGSPDTKETILAREIAAGRIPQPALFLGDSIYDHRAATSAELDFVFVSGWSDVADWQSYTAVSQIPTVVWAADLLRETA